jgi:hypothetical protein
VDQYQVARPDLLVLGVQGPVEQVDVERGSRPVVERGPLGGEQSLDIDDDTPSDNGLLGPPLDSQDRCAAPDVVVGHPVVEPPSRRPAVSQAVDLRGGLQVELVQHVVPGFRVARQEFMAGGSAGAGHRRVEGIEGVVEVEHRAALNSGDGVEDLGGAGEVRRPPLRVVLKYSPAGAGRDVPAQLCVRGHVHPRGRRSGLRHGRPQC